MMELLSEPLKNALPLTLSEVAQFLSTFLSDEFLKVADLQVGSTDVLGEGRSFVVWATDCLSVCFSLRNKGFLAVGQPFYGHGGLCAKLVDDFGNTYLVKEERSDQFDLFL